MKARGHTTRMRGQPPLPPPKTFHGTQTRHRPRWHLIIILKLCLDLQQRGHLQPASRESVPGTWENQWRLLEACLGSSSEMFPKR